jgi:hypothetical protein
MVSFNSFVAMKIKVATGGHLHFADDSYVSRIKGNYTMNKMTPVQKL